MVCACSFANLLSGDCLSAVMAHLRKGEGETLCTDDLCRASVEEKRRLQKFCTGRVRVYACSPRAVKSLLEYAGANADFEFQDLKNDAERVMKACSDSVAGDEKMPPARGVWQPWFPVIDSERCVSCMKCLDFCVFGVYEKTDGKVAVANPRNCKDQCPACARMCPKSAIVFPKCEHPVISGGGGFLEAGEAAPEGGFREALKLRRLAAKGLLRKEKDAS